MGYMLFCSVWLTIKGVQATLQSLGQSNQRFGQSLKGTVSAIASNPIFRDLILSSAATYGLYLVSSLLFFDVLHMFTSFIQYLLFSPSYVNILYTTFAVELTEAMSTRSVTHTIYLGGQRERI